MRIFEIQIFNEEDKKYEELIIRAKYCFYTEGIYIFSNQNLSGGSGEVVIAGINSKAICTIPAGKSYISKIINEEDNK